MHRIFLAAAAALTVLAPRPAAAQSPAAASPEVVRWVLAPEGNEARYRIQEQLANLDLPNDAVGATRDITGSLVLDADGNVITEESRFVVQTGTLTSDRDRRDGYVRRRILLTDDHPEVVFVPTAVRGLPTPLPTSGEHRFELVGDLTVTGTTAPATWQVTAAFSDDAIAGTAVTRFQFETFELMQPRVSIVLSVEDDIRLEYDFRLIREDAR